MNPPIVWPALIGKPRELWLWGTFHDLFWITGGASLLFALAAIPFSLASPGATAGFVASFITLSVLCNAPHYAATYEVIYRERAQNPEPWNTLLASVPLLFAALLIGGIYVEAALPVALRVYFTWSAYHYGAQHFGLAAMYGARAGRPFDPAEKRALKLAFLAAGVFQMLLLNSKAHSAVRTYVRPTEQVPEGIGWLAAALLPASTYYLVLAVFAGGLAAFVVLAVRRARAGRPLPFAVFLLFATHVAWFVLPNLRLRAEDTPWVGPNVGGWLPAAIPFFHCAQYLGVVGWRVRTSGPVRPLFLWVALIAGGWMLFDGLGLALGAAFSRPAMQLALVTSLVNLHHFWIDGLIWQKKRMPAPMRAELLSAT